jgi:hypothetical protein
MFGMPWSEVLWIGLVVLILMACGVIPIAGAAAGGLKWLK